uniref:NF-kappa-B essential modulator NEMO CC2-LZ domain-containing protein n=1 Tax=Dendroctonus ponderosae TaxID=77166 RepID=A0AAR5P8M0_DENPD
MASKDASVDRQISEQPVSVQDDLEPVPNSPENESFVVIKSAQDLASIDDNDIPDFSMTLEHKDIIREELAHFETFSNQPQPSVNSYVFAINPVNESTADLNRSQAQSIESSKPFAKGINNELPSLSSTSSFPALPQMANNEDTAISIADFSRSDFCSEGIQEKVYQLIEENTHLRATVIQNNKSMRAQYDLVVAWRKDVERVHLANKQAFLDRSKLIETLKDEVSALKEENELLRQPLNASKSKIENDVTESELFIAKENIQKLEKAFEQLNIQNKQEAAESSQKIKQLEEALANSTQKQNELQMYAGKVKILEEDVQKITIKASQDLSCEAEKLKGVEMKLAGCEAELESVFKKNSNLEKQMSDNEQIKKTLERKLFESEQTNARSQRELMLMKNQVMQWENTRAADTCEKLQRDFDEVLAEKATLIAELDTKKSQSLDDQALIETLRQEIAQTQQIVKVHEAQVAYAKEKEEEAKVDAWMSKQKIDALEQKLQLSQKASVCSDELTLLRQQLMQSQMALTDCNQKLAMAESNMLSLKTEKEELLQRIESRQARDDDIEFALKAQLKMYETDFTAEREAKEDVKRENRRISDDLQQLHRRNQQLQEEIEHLREQITQRGGQVAERRTSQTSNNINRGAIVCPGCSLRFNSIHEIEVHVLRCPDFRA